MNIMNRKKQKQENEKITFYEERFREALSQPCECELLQL